MSANPQGQQMGKSPQPFLQEALTVQVAAPDVLTQGQESESQGQFI